MNINKNKTKKILFSIGIISTISAVPIAVISCSTSSHDSNENTQDSNENTNKKLIDALNNINLSLSNKGKITLPSQVISSKITDYIHLPNPLDNINFSFLQPNSFNDEQGSLVVTLVATINNNLQSKIMTIFGFKTNQINKEEAENMQYGLKLLQNINGNISLKSDANNIKPSELTMKNINNYVVIENNNSAVYSIISVQNSNNISGSVVLNIQLNYKGIILNTEVTIFGFKQDSNIVILPSSLQKLADEKGVVLNLSTGIDTKLTTNGYKTLVEQMNLDANSLIDSNLIKNINKLISENDIFKNIKVAVKNGTSNLEGKVILFLSGSFKDENIANNTTITISGFSKSIISSTLENLSLNDFELNTSNYLNNFQTGLSLQKINSYLQWKQYISKLIMKKQHSSVTYNLLDYFNNPGITQKILFNYDNKGNLNISFDILNSSFVNEQWQTKWTTITIAEYTNSFLPIDTTILSHFVQTLDINHNSSLFKITPSELYWKLKADSDIVLKQLFFVNPQIQLTYFPESDLNLEIEANINEQQYNDSNGSANISFELSVNNSSVSQNIQVNGFKTFDDKFNISVQNNNDRLNNVIQLNDEGSIAKRLIKSLQNLIKSDETIFVDESVPTNIKVNYPLIPGSSSVTDTNYLLIHNGVLKWNSNMMKNFSNFELFGLSFFNSFNINTHAYGTKQNNIGINNLSISWSPNISIYKKNNVYTFFTSLKVNLLDFGLNKNIDVHYFLSITQSQLEPITI